MDTAWIIIEFLVNVLDSTLILLLVSSSLTMRIQNRWMWGVYVAALTTICTIANIYCSSMFQMLLVLTVSLLLFTIFLTKGTFLTKLLWTFLTQIIFFGIDMLHDTLVVMLITNVPTDIIYQPGPIRLFNIIVTRALIIAIVFWLRKRKLLFASFTHLQSICLMLCPLLSWVALLSVAKLFVIDRVTDGFVLIGTLLICVINVVYVYLFLSIVKQDRQLQEDSLIIQKMDIERQQYETIKALNEDMSSWKHDMKKHLQTISSYAKSKEDEKILDYIDEIESGIFKSYVYVFTDNPLFDNLVGIEAKKANDKGINVSLELVAPPLDFINDTDICSIIGNLWDNAIEGCERAYSNKKNILFKTYVNKTWFILELTNTSPDMMGTNLKTTKIGGSHGLGIKTIQKILDDHYSGIYEYTTTHSTFTAKVGLLMHPQKQIEESACRVFYWKS